MKVYVCVYVCREAAWMGEGVWERGVGTRTAFTCLCCVATPLPALELLVVTSAGRGGGAVVW